MTGAVSLHNWLPRCGALWPQYAIWTVLLLAIALVKAMSATADLQRLHLAIVPWHVYCLALTSWAGWLPLLWPLLAWDRAVSGARLAPAAAACCTVAAVLPISALHVSFMVSLRFAAYRWNGDYYHFGPPLKGFLVEFRRDALVILMVLGLAYLWRRLQRSAEPAPQGDNSADPVFLAPRRDCDELIRAAEIDWVEAQGNYIALHVGDQVRLLRVTMKDVESRLSSAGFLRSHRSALVNMGRVKAIVRTELGKNRIRFEGRDTAPLSDRRRAEFMKALERR